MSRKASRSSIAKKAWKTRRQNAKMENLPKEETNKIERTAIDLETWTKMQTKQPVRSIADEMDEAITELEARMRATTKRIKQIMKVS